MFFSSVKEINGLLKEINMLKEFKIFTLKLHLRKSDTLKT